MNENIQEFIKSKRLAVVGVSRSGKKFGNMICTELRERGYQVSIVHPEAKEIDGQPCLPNLAALQGKVDGVVICVAPSQAGQVMREAVQAGISKIWLQQGAQSTETDTLARELGVTPVSGKCILMYAAPVRSFHSWHRAFARIFGQL
jgi:predicted CoA-binding protein